MWNLRKPIGWLREDITEAERKALTVSSSMQGDDLVQQTQRIYGEITGWKNNDGL